MQGPAYGKLKLLCGSPFQIAAAPRRSALLEVRVSAEGPFATSLSSLMTHRQGRRAVQPNRCVNPKP